MDNDLKPLMAALAACSEAELDALINATWRADGALAFVAWVETVCRWELDRRHDRPEQRDLRFGTAPGNAVHIDSLLALRWVLRGRAQCAAFDVLDELERLLHMRPVNERARFAEAA